MNERLSHVIEYTKWRSKKLEDRKKLERKLVYVILCGDYVKIGIAINPDKRLANMQVGCPVDMKIIARFPSDDAARDERRLHHLLRKFNHRGEWFKLPDNLVGMIIKAKTVGELLGDKL